METTDLQQAIDVVVYVAMALAFCLGWIAGQQR